LFYSRNLSYSLIMKKIIFILTLFLSFNLFANGRDYRCLMGEDYTVEMYLTNNTSTFISIYDNLSGELISEAYAALLKREKGMSFYIFFPRTGNPIAFVTKVSAALHFPKSFDAFIETRI